MNLRRKLTMGICGVGFGLMAYLGGDLGKVYFIPKILLTFLYVCLGGLFGWVFSGDD